MKAKALSEFVESLQAASSRETRIGESMRVLQRIIT
jgi:hypothetical protein